MKRVVSCLAQTRGPNKDSIRIVRDQSLRLLLDRIGSHEIPLAHHAKQGHVQFIALRSADSSVLDPLTQQQSKTGPSLICAANFLQQFKEERDRVFHVVFGIPGRTVDFVADIDLPETPKPEKHVIELLEATKDYMKTTHGVIDTPRVLVLDACRPGKISYHVHIRWPQHVFADFQALRKAAKGINAALPKVTCTGADPVDTIDMALYRKYGSIRLAYNIKPSSTGTSPGILLPMTNPIDPKLRQLLKEGNGLQWDMRDALAFSLVLRDPSPELTLITSGGAGSNVKAKVLEAFDDDAGDPEGKRRMSRIARGVFVAHDPAKVETISGSPARSYRLTQVVDQVTDEDAILACREGQALFSFWGYRGLRREALAKRILEMDADEKAAMYSVYGRVNVPCDFFAMINVPHYSGKTDGDAFCDGPKTEYTGETLLEMAIKLTKEHCFNRLKVPEQPRILIIDGKNPHKHVYHLHIQFQSSAFKDYRAVRDAATAINAEAEFQLFDIAVYQANAIKSLACTKLSTGPATIFQPESERSPLALLLKSHKSLSWPDAVEALAASFSFRSATERFSFSPGPAEGDDADRPAEYNPDKSFTIHLLKGDKSRTTVGPNGEMIPAYLADNKKWQRFGECVAAIRRLPASDAEAYDTWIRVGLALHSFGNESHIFDHWVNFSQRCPHKFSLQACQRYWGIFSKRPECFTWRRGFNYLTRTVTRLRA